MISLELAKKLKISGLAWEPSVGDWVYMDGEPICIFEFSDIFRVSPDSWIPSLSQLLAEIEKYRYVWDLDTNWAVDYVVEGYKFHVKKRGGVFRGFDADTPDEAAAHALLWILARAEDKSFVPAKHGDCVYGWGD